MTWFGLVILNTRSCLVSEKCLLKPDNRLFSVIPEFSTRNYFSDNSRNLGESSKYIHNGKCK